MLRPFSVFNSHVTDVTSKRIGLLFGNTRPHFTDSSLQRISLLLRLLFGHEYRLDIIRYNSKTNILIRAESQSGIKVKTELRPGDSIAIVRKQ